MNDMSQVITPKSDQINADDLLAGPMTIRINAVKVAPGTEQPVSIYFDGSDKAYRPCKSMARCMVAAWGPNSAEYVGRSLTLYCDPKVKWGGLEVGGIRISRMSHIDGPKSVPIIIKKGRSGGYKVTPLPAGTPSAEPTPEDLAAQLVAALADCTTEAEVREWGNRAHARNLLDVQINGQTVKSHVEYRLAELADATQDSAS